MIPANPHKIPTRTLSGPRWWGAETCRSFIVLCPKSPRCPAWEPYLKLVADPLCRLAVARTPSPPNTTPSRVARQPVCADQGASVRRPPTPALARDPWSAAACVSSSGCHGAHSPSWKPNSNQPWRFGERNRALSNEGAGLWSLDGGECSTRVVVPRTRHAPCQAACVHRANARVCVCRVPPWRWREPGPRRCGPGRHVGWNGETEHLARKAGGAGVSRGRRGGESQAGRRVWGEFLGSLA